MVSLSPLPLSMNSLTRCLLAENSTTVDEDFWMTGGQPAHAHNKTPSQKNLPAKTHVHTTAPTNTFLHWLFLDDSRITGPHTKQYYTLSCLYCFYIVQQKFYNSLQIQMNYMTTVMFR